VYSLPEIEDQSTTIITGMKLCASSALVVSVDFMFSRSSALLSRDIKWQFHW